MEGVHCKYTVKVTSLMGDLNRETINTGFTYLMYDGIICHPSKIKALHGAGISHVLKC